MDNVLFKRGTSGQYAALEKKDGNALYFLTDTLQFYLGDKLLGTGAEATDNVAGLLSPGGKAELDKLKASGILSLRAVDASLDVKANEEGMTIGVRLSGKPDNAVTVEEDGLYVPKAGIGEYPVYEIERMEDAGEYQAVYKLKKTAGGQSEYVGSPIELPKDKVVKEGALKVVEKAGQPYPEAEVGDPYLDITFANDSETHVYIPVKELVDTVEAGEGIIVKANTVSVKPVFEKAKYDVVGLLDGARWNVYGREIRVFFPSDAKFEKPTGSAEGRDNNSYYVGIRFYAPFADVTGFKEGEEKADGDMEDFEGTSSGVDEYGRKYDVCWFPVAHWDDEDQKWTYFGDQSLPGKCVGWHHTIEWYKDDQCVGSETVRVNLTNADCHDSLRESLGEANTATLEWQNI